MDTKSCTKAVIVFILSIFISGCAPIQKIVPTIIPSISPMPTNNPPGTLLPSFTPIAISQLTSTATITQTLTYTKTAIQSIPATQPFTPSPPVVYYNPIYFDAAASILGGQRIIVDFEDIPGDIEFDGSYYGSQGISFSNINNFPFFIAPGGARAWGQDIWNESNSLSIGNYPWQADTGNYNTDDDLSITFDPPCKAVGFILVDNLDSRDDERIEFIDSLGNVIIQSHYSSNYLPYRGFVGVVSPGFHIATINIFEAVGDNDDICYDDIICYR